MKPLFTLATSEKVKIVCINISLHWLHQIIQLILNGKFLDGLSFTERLKKLRIGFEKYFGRRIPVMNLSLFTA